MIPVWILDFSGMLASLAGVLVIIVRGRVPLRRDTRLLLLFLLVIEFLHSLSNMVEWTGISSTFDELEDTVEVIRPLLWLFFLYSFLQAQSAAMMERNQQRLQQLINEASASRERERKLQKKMQEAQRLESLGLLAGSVAHDFNNLLVGVMGNVGFLLDKISVEDSRRVYAERIDIAAERAAGLARQLLAFSGRGKFLVEAVDINAVIKEIVSLLGVSISKNARLVLNLSVEGPHIKADLSQIQQVFMNLVINASDALEGQGGEIEILSSIYQHHGEMPIPGLIEPESLSPGSYACVHVRDTGCGISAEDLSQIFDPFFTTKTTGRGLGLAAVLSIIKSHSGAIAVQSKIGGGTEFITYFPLFQTSKLEETARGGASEVSFSSLSALGSVLVIDDEESVREVALALMQECGVRGFSAENGLEGIALFEKKREEVFAVLLDLTMPGISGEETYCEIRKIAPNLPVIFTSGYSEGSRIEKMLGGSPGGFLKKPFRLDELKEVLLRSLSAN